MRTSGVRMVPRLGISGQVAVALYRVIKVSVLISTYLAMLVMVAMRRLASKRNGPTRTLAGGRREAPSEADFSRRSAPVVAAGSARAAMIPQNIEFSPSVIVL